MVTNTKAIRKSSKGGLTEDGRLELEERPIAVTNKIKTI